MCCLRQRQRHRDQGLSSLAGQDGGYRAQASGVLVPRAVTPPRPARRGECGGCGSSDGARALSWLSHGSAPTRVVRHDPRHRPELRRDHQGTALLRSAGPTGSPADVAHAQPGRLHGRGRHIRLPVVLGRWRGSGDRLPAPRVPARRLRPWPASPDRATRLRQDSRPLPGAAERARGDAPGTR